MQLRAQIALFELVSGEMNEQLPALGDGAAPPGFVVARRVVVTRRVVVDAFELRLGRTIALDWIANLT